MTRNVLVTGAAGFMGSWLVDQLVDEGYDVMGVDNLLGGYERNINQKSKFVKLDLRDFKAVQDLCKDVDVIYHLAAYAAEGQSVFSPAAINDINVTPMNNLLVAAINNNVRRFVFTSSMAVYGAQTPPFDETMERRPEDPYGVGKAYCEQMLEIFGRTYGLEYTVLRPHNVYGPRQNIYDPYRNVLGIWMNRIMRKLPPMIYGDGEQTRAFSYVNDIISCIIKAGFADAANKQTINIGSDEVVSVNEACDLIMDITGARFKPTYIEERPNEVKHAYCTVQKSIDILQYKTKYRLKDGLREMYSWAKKVGPQEPTYTLPLEITKNAPTVWVKKTM